MLKLIIFRPPRAARAPVFSRTLPNRTVRHSQRRPRPATRKGAADPSEDEP